MRTVAGLSLPLPEPAACRSPLDLRACHDLAEAQAVRTRAVSDGTKIATDLPLRSAGVPNTAAATLAPAPGSSMFPMMMPFAPTSAAFLRIDVIMPASVVKPVLPVELSRATS